MKPNKAKKLDLLIEEFLIGMPNINTRQNHLSDLRSLQTYFSPWTGKETRLELIKYVRSLEAANLMPTTIRERCIRLIKLYRFLANNGHRLDVPIDMSIAPRVRIMTTPKSPDWKQIKSLIKVIESKKGKDLRDATMVGLMLFEGLRVSEVAKLRIGDVQEVSHAH